MLEVNDIIAEAPGKPTVIEGFARLVGVDNNRYAYLIRLDNSPLTAPFPVALADLIAAINAGDILLGQEIELDIVASEDQLSQEDKDKIEEAVSLISPLFQNNEALFDSGRRGQMFKDRATRCGVSARKIRRLYYLYLWGGQNQLALAPRYFKCGGGKQTAGSKRRGPKAKDEAMASEVPLPAVSEELGKGARMYFLQGSRTLEEAFMETKKTFFKKGTTIERGKRVKEVLLPPGKLPSLKQFRYVCDELQRTLGIKVRKVARRIRQKRPEWDFIGWSRDQVPGPGFRFEIDATKLQVRLVSRYNRAKVLNDATLYVIVDIWSGAIVGYALSLQNASWALAARALHNCFTDKQEVFDRLDLRYTSDDWPCQHLPSRLAADRGEIVSNKAGLVPEIGIVVEIMPPMCPERKGKVESTIKNIKHGHSHRLPGRHPKSRQRRETDGTESAALTIDELERIIVEIIMGLNHEPVPIHHIPPEMVEDGETDVTHVGLYRWGLEHYFGYTRKLPAKDVYENLMTKGVAHLTSRGLYFKSQTFVSGAVVNALPYERTFGKGGLLVDIRYDEHHADAIWFFDGKANEWVQAVNSDESVHRRKAAFFELEVYREEVKRLRRAAKDESLHQNSERDKDIRSIVKPAEAEAKEDRKGTSKASRRKDMRGNTQLEIDAGKMIAAGATAPLQEKVAEGPNETPANDNKVVASLVEGIPSPASQFPGMPQPEGEETIKSKLTVGELTLQMWRKRK